MHHHYLSGDYGLGCNLGCRDRALSGGVPLKGLGLGCAGTHGFPRLLWRLRRRRPRLLVSDGGEEVLNVEMIWRCGK